MINQIIILLVLAGCIPRLGTPRLKRYLLGCGIFTIPFSYDYTLYAFTAAPFMGWTEGVLVSLSQVFFGLILVLCRRVKSSPNGVAPARFCMDWPIGAFLITAFISMLFPIDRKCALVAVITLSMNAFLFYWVITRYCSWEEDGEFILRCFAVAVIFQACLAMWQAAFQTGFYFFRTGSPPMLTGDEDYMRSQGTTPQPNGFAGYLNLVMIPLFAGWLVWKSPDRRLLKVALAMGGIALMTSLSRGGWMALLAGVLFVFFHSGSRRWVRPVLLTTAVFVLIVALVPQLRERVTGDDGGSAQDRWKLAQIATGMIADHPILGVGINNYRLAMWSYVPENYDWKFVYRVHTLPLLILAEMGIVGFAGLCWLFWRGITMGRRLFAPPENIEAWIAIGAAGACVATLLHSFVDVVWTSPSINAQFFATLGIGALASRAASKTAIPTAS